MLEAVVTIVIVLLAAIGVGYSLYRSAIGKSGCSACQRSDSLKDWSCNNGNCHCGGKPIGRS